MSVDDRDLCQCQMYGRLHKRWRRRHDEYHEGEGVGLPKLSCPGVGRDKDCVSALEFYFSRRVTDDEMRFLKDVIDRAVVCMPSARQ